MHDLFDPSSIAVVGASDDTDKIGGQLLAFLQKHGYQGEIYPVNPNRERIQGLRCYPTVEDVPVVPKVAVVVVPAALVLDIVEAYLQAGGANVVIISSGFSETGAAEGRRAEETLRELATRYDANVIGPNSQGFINVPGRVAASFTPALKRDDLLAGDISFVTQSGAFGGALTTMFQEDGLGLNKVVATGNEASIEALDIVDYLAHDADTDIAAGYIEGFEDGRKLLELKRTDEGIDLPIVFLKVGRSGRAKEAARSHTGKLAGRYAVYESVFEETGVISVESVGVFVSTCMALSRLSGSANTALPGERVGVVTTSGGAGVHIADVVAEEGLTLPSLSESTRESVEGLIPEYGSAINPVDSTAQVSVEERCGIVERLLEEDGVDIVLFQMTNASGDYAVEYAEQLVEIAEDHETPLFVCWTGGFDKSEALAVYEGANVPVFEDPSVCVKVIAGISRFESSKPPLRDSKDLPARIEATDAEGPEGGKLTEVEAKRLLEKHGVRTPAERLVNAASEAVAAAEELGYPVIAKIVASDLDHRNEVGGVSSELSAPEDVRAAYEELEALSRELDLDPEGLVIQERVEGDLELSVGLLTETVFGPVVMLGRGGTDIEEARDVTFRTVPLSPSQARTMLDDLECIDGDRLTRIQRESIVDSVVAVSDLYLENRWIGEGDVNPLIVTSEGAVAVDGLFIAE